VTGKLAVKIGEAFSARVALLLGDGDGADATIRLDVPAEDLGEAFVREAGDSGFQVAIDYVWGRPAEAFLAAINTQGIFCHHVRDSLRSTWGKGWADYLAFSCLAA
jgi:NADPH2:quinone reductase